MLSTTESYNICGLLGSFFDGGVFIVCLPAINVPTSTLAKYISVFYACISTQKDMMTKASSVNSIFYFNERHQKTFGDTRRFETCDTVEIIVILRVLSGREDQNLC